ncbi:PREDICTED: matrix metalloproteinase-28-like isoform X2 [Priapulus caudatus]|nr:PREDICTED: matrix metalloproteinase-28-like isoform X2 [Priapulus caudatus]
MGRAITNFQYMADIAQTGRLDDVTLRKMEEPRCGVKDSFLQEDGAAIAAKVQYRSNRRSRIKSAKLRQGLGAGFFSRWWFKCDFTWNVINGHDKRSRDVTRTLVRRALSQWSNAINRGRRSPIFTFREEPDRNDTDLRFSYEKGKHGDSNAFDGPQGVLAHAFFPYISGDFEGQLHIDGDEDWQGSSSVGQLLYYVIMHEIGHIFGLTHSNKESSVMYGYLGFERSSIRHLRHEDIKRIRAHYPYRFCDIYAKRHSSLLDSNYKKTQRATPAPGTKH